jgi:hypothetical protein
MSERPLLQLTAVAALLAPFLWTGVASAEELKAFRGGIALEGGTPIVPPGFIVGMVGAQGHAGVQYAEFGFYAAPCVDFLFGRYRGLNLSGALMFDMTLDLREVLMIGFGPEAGGFVALAGPPREPTADYYAGLKFHVGFNLILDEIPWELSHAKALSLGLDLHLVGYGDTDRFASTPVAEHKGGPLLWAMLTVGYKRF